MEEVKEKADTDEFEQEIPKDIISCLRLLDGKVCDTYLIGINGLIITFFFRKLLETSTQHLKMLLLNVTEVYGCVRSILDFIDLSYNASAINVNTEKDLLDDVYGFIRTSRAISKLSTSK